MSRNSPYRLSNAPKPFILPLDPPSSLFFLDNHSRNNSLDLSNSPSYHYSPPVIGDSILSNMRSEISFVKSDLQNLIRA